ncbi:MAG TPA: MOSC N-terminal beta barrel domain-containing protein [Lapillicoccus sp.]|nr:MOSC N-terminal beta barrel domain-containing protein [Lapillicoccus sp.]
MRVTGLRLYPVKSLGGVEVESAVVEPWGFAGDRRWALVDEAGELVTAREVHQLLRLTAEPVDDDTIRITDRADGESILVDTPLGLTPVPVSISRQGSAPPADDDVSAWVSDRVGTRLRLVWQEDPRRRPISGAHGGQPGDVMNLADAGPVLLVSETSMARLNEWISAENDQPDVPDISPDDISDAAAGPVTGALDILRFRGNVVIDGEGPFAEDGWPGVRVGDVEFRTTECCDRCVMTTLDPVTLEGGKEPIRTMARHRRWDGKTWFGTRLVRTGGGDRVHVGDPVDVLG